VEQISEEKPAALLALLGRPVSENVLDDEAVPTMTDVTL